MTAAVCRRVVEAIENDDLIGQVGGSPCVLEGRKRRSERADSPVGGTRAQRRHDRRRTGRRWPVRAPHGSNAATRGVEKYDVHRLIGSRIRGIARKAAQKRIRERARADELEKT